MFQVPCPWCLRIRHSYRQLQCAFHHCYHLYQKHMMMYRIDSLLKMKEILTPEQYKTVRTQMKSKMEGGKGYRHGMGGMGHGKMGHHGYEHDKEKNHDWFTILTTAMKKAQRTVPFRGYVWFRSGRKGRWASVVSWGMRVCAGTKRGSFTEAVASDSVAACGSLRVWVIHRSRYWVAKNHYFLALNLLGLTLTISWLMAMT